MRMHDLKTVISDHTEIQYFYTREKNDKNGNPRYRVYIIDPETPAIYETIAHTYDGLIPQFVIRFVEGVKHCL